MSTKKAALLAGIYAASVINTIINPYEGLPELRYTGSKYPARKSILTKKQKKARAKSKQSKQSRKKNRR